MRARITCSFALALILFILAQAFSHCSDLIHRMLSYTDTDVGYGDMDTATRGLTFFKNKDTPIHRVYINFNKNIINKLSSPGRCMMHVQEERT
jgi:hypothetical protein